jgi:hypothetical protein
VCCIVTLNVCLCLSDSCRHLACLAHVDVYSICLHPLIASAVSTTHIAVFINILSICALLYMRLQLDVPYSPSDYG